MLDKNVLLPIDESSGELFRLAFEGAPNGMIMVNQKGEIVLSNSQMEKLFGYSREELLGKSIELLVPQRYRAKHPEQRNLFIKKPEARAMGAGRDLFGRRKDGSEFPVEIGLNPLMTESGPIVLASVIDITERKKAEERFRLVVEGAPNGMIMVDEQGQIILLNSQIERLFGYRKEELHGKRIEILVPERFRTPHPAQRAHFFHDPKARAMGAGRELFGRRKDGSEFPVEIGLNPMVTESGHLVLASVIDISERKKAEEERARLYEMERILRGEAERANRMKDEFLSTLSHELRSPLNAILGWAQLMSRKKEDSAQIDRGIEIIIRNAKAQSQIISDLLDMNRVISGKMDLDKEEVEILSLIDNAVESIHPIAEAKKLSIKKPETSLRAVLDPNRIQQCLWNLLTNAVKFTPPGGEVSINIDEFSESFEISVSDTGFGIEPEFLPYVFDRFRQADASSTRKHGGLGLGLAIVKSLVELHGGSVGVESAGENLGSTFKMCFPHIRQEAKRAPRPAFTDRALEEVSGPDLSGLTILVVDDELDARELIKELLTEHGATVVTAASADEALGQIKQFKPDLVISDIGMPSKDGLAFMKEVRSLPSGKGGKTPSIALTAYARPEDRTNALLSGFQMHLTKPVEPLELLAAVMSLKGLV